MTEAEILQAKIDHYFDRLDNEALVRSNTPSRVGMRPHAKRGPASELYDYARRQWLSST